MTTAHINALTFRKWPKLTAVVTVLGLTGLMSGFSLPSYAQEAAVCEVPRPIKLSAMPWPANQVLIGVESFLLQHGYGCEVEPVAVEANNSVEALVQEQVDVGSEIWLKTVEEGWEKASAEGQVVRGAELFMSAEPKVIPEPLQAHVPTHTKEQAADDIPACISDPKCEYPKNAVFSAFSQNFYQQAPELSAFFANVRIAPELMQDIQARLDEGESVEEVVQWFLSQQQDVWRQWLSITAAQRVNQAL